MAYGGGVSKGKMIQLRCCEGGNNETERVKGDGG